MRPLTVALLFLVSIGFARGESYERARTMVRYSKNGNVIVRIDPGAPKFFGGDGRLAHCQFYRYSTVARRYEFWREQDLVNTMLPLSVLFPDDGSFLITFDEHIAEDASENAVVAYDGRGNLLKRWSVEDILSKAEILARPLTRDYMGLQVPGLWHDDFGISYRDPKKIVIMAPLNDAKGIPKYQVFILNLNTLTLRHEVGEE